MVVALAVARGAATVRTSIGLFLDLCDAHRALSPRSSSDASMSSRNACAL
jgi:hypothetical protein